MHFLGSFRHVQSERMPQSLVSSPTNCKFPLTKTEGITEIRKRMSGNQKGWEY